MNKSDEAYRDNLGYEDAFGGSIMLSVITMDEGHTVDELFDTPGRAQFEAFHTSLTDSGRVQGRRHAADRARVHAASRHQPRREPGPQCRCPATAQGGGVGDRRIT